VLAFVSNEEMQGGKEVSEYQLLAREGLANFGDESFVPSPEDRPRCAAARWLSRKVATGGGLRLGMDRAAVVKLLGHPDRSERAALVYTSSLEIRPPKSTTAGGSGSSAPEDPLTRVRSLVVEFAKGRVNAIRAGQCSAY
jgi:hypothetical protein